MHGRGQSGVFALYRFGEQTVNNIKKQSRDSGSAFCGLYVNSWGKEKPIERKKQVVKNETERSEVEFSLPAFARWVIEICTEYENGSV